MFVYFHCFNSVKNKSSNTYYVSDVVNIYFTMDVSSFKGSKRHTGHYIATYFLHIITKSLFWAYLY